MPRLKEILWDYNNGVLSDDGGSEHLVITAGKARGSDTGVREVWIRPHKDATGELRVLISADTDCEATTGLRIDDLTVPLILAVTNLNLLSFRGNQNGDIVDILYRS